MRHAGCVRQRVAGLILVLLGGVLPLPTLAATPAPNAPLADSATGAAPGGTEAAYQELRIVPSSSGVRVGRPLILRAEALDPEGRWVPVRAQWEAPTGSTVSQAGHFVAQEPGEYQVTATLGDLRATLRITVWGPPDRVVLTAPSHLVGDGTSRIGTLVRVVDQRGTQVADFTGAIRLGLLPAGRVWPQGAVEPGFGMESVQNAVAGEARFYLAVPGSLTDRTITLTAWADRNDDGRFLLPDDTTARQEIEVVAALRPQVALQADARLLPADGSPTRIRIGLRDATGRPMAVDDFTAEVRVTGPATASANRVPLAGGVGEFWLYGQAPGTVQVTVNVPGGIEASLNLEARTPGPARGVRIFPAELLGPVVPEALAGDGPALVAGTDPWEGLLLGVQVVDGAGVPVSSPLERPVRLQVNLAGNVGDQAVGTNPAPGVEPPTTAAGDEETAEAAAAATGASQIRLDGQPLDPGAPHQIVAIPAGQSTGYVRVQAAAFSGPLGLLAQMEGVDPTLIAPGTLEVQVVGGSPAGVRLSAAEVLTVLDGVNLASVVVTVVDRFGNPSPTDDVQVELTAEGTGVEVQISGDERPGVVYSQDGTARFTLRLDGRARRRVQVQLVGATYQRQPLTVDPDHATATLSLIAAPPRVIEDVQILAGGRSVSRRVVGDEVTILVRVTDPAGVPVSDTATAQALRVSYSSRMARAVSGSRFSYDRSAGGYVAGPFRLTGAGTATFTVTYTGGSQRQTARASVSVRAGAAATVRVREARSGRLTVNSETMAGPYTLEVTDAYGNPASFSSAVDVTLSYTGPEGGTLEVRTQPTGVSTARLSLRQQAQFYFITTQAGTYQLTFHLPDGQTSVLRITARD